ncbi:hypothetical protein [Thermaurantiacus sp.]
MQRIRAGLTGLSLVLIVTLLGSLAYAPRSAAPGPAEPLSELGVAPSPGVPRGAPPAETGKSPVADRAPEPVHTPDQVSI